MNWIRQILGGRRRQGPAAELSAFLSRPALIDFDSLGPIARQCSAAYASAEPFPHVLLENFLSADAIDSLLAEFPRPQDQIPWKQAEEKTGAGELMQHNKLGMSAVDQMPPPARELMWELNSGTFLRFLEQLTGIAGLIADPRLHGGGIHQVLAGGFLGVHADFTSHGELGLTRRLNVLIYLNRDWRDEYGGALELWSCDMSRCVRRIRPLAGRCVIFNTSENSFHGHPQPLHCPAHVSRKSIATYYYSQGREDHLVAPTQRTDWQPLPSAQLPPLE